MNSVFLQEKNTAAIVVFGIVCAFTGEIYRGARFVLPRGWRKKTLVKYSSSNFTCVAVDKYNTAKRENLIGLDVELDSISRNEELCFFWRNACGLGVPPQE